MAAGGKQKETADSATCLIYGDDSYPVTTEARKLVDRLCPPDQQAFGLDVIDGTGTTVEEAILCVRRTLEALQTLPFMGGRKVVWLRDATFFQDNLVGRSRGVKEVVEGLVDMIKKGMPSDTFLVITAPKVDGRSAFAKACAAHARVAEFSVPDQSAKNERAIKERATDWCKERHLRMEDRALARLIEKTGYDTRQILNELDKLVTYLGSRQDVNVEDVDAIVSASRETLVWDFADAVAERRLPAALKIRRQLAFQGEKDVGLVIGLERRYRELLTLRECLDREWLTLSGQAPWYKVHWEGGAEADAALSVLEKDPRKTNPFRTARLAAQARQNSGPRLVRCLQLAMDAHERMVSGGGSVSDITLENLVIRLLA